MTPEPVKDKQNKNRWSDSKLKEHGYKHHGLVNTADRSVWISDFIAKKVAQGYHCVLRREYRGVYRRLYMKKIKDVTNETQS